MGIWILINHKELVSKHSVRHIFCYGILYFLVVDNKQNDVGINGDVYIIVVAVIAVIWFYIMWKLHWVTAWHHC